MALIGVFESGNNMMNAEGVAQHGASTRGSTGSRPTGRWNRTLGVARLGLLLNVAVSGCAREDDSTPASSSPIQAPSMPATQSKLARNPSRIYSVGQQAQGQGYSATVTRIVECRLEKDWHERAGEFYLGVELLVQAGPKASVAFGPPHTRLTDANQTAYSAEPVVKTQNCEPPLKYMRLAPSASAKRWLVYSVPKHAHTLTLRLNPRPYLKEPELAFALGR